MLTLLCFPYVELAAFISAIVILFSFNDILTTQRARTQHFRPKTVIPRFGVDMNYIFCQVTDFQKMRPLITFGYNMICYNLFFPTMSKIKI